MMNQPTKKKVQAHWGYRKAKGKELNTPTVVKTTFEEAYRIRDSQA